MPTPPVVAVMMFFHLSDSRFQPLTKGVLPRSTHALILFHVAREVRFKVIIPALMARRIISPLSGDAPVCCTVRSLAAGSGAGAGEAGADTGPEVDPIFTYVVLLLLIARVFAGVEATATDDPLSVIAPARAIVVTTFTALLFNRFPRCREYDITFVRS